MKRYINTIIYSGVVSSGLFLIACNGGKQNIAWQNQSSKASSVNLLNVQQKTEKLNIKHPFPQSSLISYHLADGSTVIYPIAKQDSDVTNFYNYWKNSYLANAGISDGNTLYRIKFGKSGTNANSTVSEGQGYGMIITTIMAGYDESAQPIFDGLFRYVKAHPSHIDNRLMGWKQPINPEDNDSAFDGDADIALALILADQQWGSAGSINYLQEAKTIISGIQDSTIGVNSYLPMLGDWVLQNGEPYNQWTPRPSDFMFDNFRAFAYATNHYDYWNNVINSSHLAIEHIQSRYSVVSGLLPDFIIGTSFSDFSPAHPYFLESENDGNYAYNAGRTPWRLGVDALLNQDQYSLAETRKMSYWIEQAANDNPLQINAGYFLDGSRISDGNYFSSFFAAPFGVAAMSGGSSQQEWLNAIYNAVVDKHEDYYQDSVTMLSLLIMTGNYWGVNTFQ